MRIKNYFSCVCAAFIAALSLVGCSDYDNGYTEKNIIYNKQFTDRFGQIDPNQDWNLVKQLAKASRGGETRATTSETVFSGTYGKEGDIQITVERTDEDDCILWTYEDIAAYDDVLPENPGGTDLPYHRPEGNTEQDKYTNLGMVTQDFMLKGKTFTMYPLYWNTGRQNYDVIGIYYYVPEGTKAEDGEDIRTITIAEGETRTIKLVPICKGNHSNELEKVKDVWAYVDLSNLDVKYKNALIRRFPNKYKLAEESDSQFQTGKLLILDDDTKEYIEVSDYNKSKETVIEDLLSISDKFKIVDESDVYTDEWGNTINVGTFVVDILKSDGYVTMGNALEDFTGGITHFRSWGIKVTVPEDINFGFYIENSTDYGGVYDREVGTKFSETILNEKVKFSDTGEEEQEVAYAATYDGVDGEGKPCRYLCFEDWMNLKNFDLNDVVFRVVGIEDYDVIDEDKPQEDTKKEEEVTTVISEGLLVCEDLGDFDFDFNDIVLKLQQKQTKKVTTVNGVKQSEEILSNTLDVTAMAAGGALTSYIYYKYDNLSEGKAISDDNEIHQLLGGSAPNIINAGSQFGSEGETIPLEIDKDLETWDETTYSDDNGGYVTQVFEHGLIYILVEDPDTGEKTEITPIKDSQEGYNKHESPQMMLLPISFQWPQERKTIDEVYTDFSKWVGDTNKTEWYKTYDDTRVTKRSTGQ